MRSQLTMDINAPPELVFAVVSDPARWPALLPHYRRVDVLRSTARECPHHDRPAGRELVARYIAVRPILPLLGLGLPVAWTSRFRADPGAMELHFRHLGGATAGMAVTWRVRAREGGTRITLEHVFARSLPLPGPLGGDGFPRLVDRLFVRPIAGRTLATFRAICESLPATWGEADSEPAPGWAPDPALERTAEATHAR